MMADAIMTSPPAKPWKREPPEEVVGRRCSAHSADNSAQHSANLSAGHSTNHAAGYLR